MISGAVDSIETRAIPTKRGMGTVYDVIVSGTKAGFGFKNPASMGIKVGTVVTFETEGKYNNVDLGTLKIGGEPVPTPAGTSPVPTPAGTSSAPTSSASAGRATAGRNTVFPVPINHGDYSIVRQNALTNARELYTAMHNSDYDEAGFQNALEDAAHRILKIAAIFEDYSSGQREAKAVAKMMESAKTTGQDLSEIVAQFNKTE